MAVELSTNERADDLLNEFNNANGMYQIMVELIKAP